MYNVLLKPEKKMNLIVRMIFKVKFVENNCKEWKSLTTPNLNIEISAYNNYYFIFMTAIYNRKNQKTVVWKSGREASSFLGRRRRVIHGAQETPPPSFRAPRSRIPVSSPFGGFAPATQVYLIICLYNIASKSAQSNSPYVGVLHNPVHCTLMARANWTFFSVCSGQKCLLQFASNSARKWPRKITLQQS